MVIGEAFVDSARAGVPLDETFVKIYAANLEINRVRLRELRDQSGLSKILTVS